MLPEFQYIFRDYYVRYCKENWGADNAALIQLFKFLEVEPWNIV